MVLMADEAGGSLAGNDSSDASSTGSRELCSLWDSTPEQLSWAAMASSRNRSSPTSSARYDGSDLPRMIRWIAFKARPRNPCGLFVPMTTSHRTLNPRSSKVGFSSLPYFCRFPRLLPFRLRSRHGSCSGAICVVPRNAPSSEGETKKRRDRPTFFRSGLLEIIVRVLYQLESCLIGERLHR